MLSNRTFRNIVSMGMPWQLHRKCWIHFLYLSYSIMLLAPCRSTWKRTPCLSQHRVPQLCDTWLALRFFFLASLLLSRHSHQKQECLNDTLTLLGPNLPLKSNHDFTKRDFIRVVEVLAHISFLNSNILLSVSECSCAWPKYFCTQFPVVLTWHKPNNVVKRKIAKILKVFWKILASFWNCIQLSSL